MRISPRFIIKRKKTKKKKKPQQLWFFSDVRQPARKKKSVSVFPADSNAGEEPLINLWQCYTCAETQLGDNQSRVQALLLILPGF